MEVLTLDTYCAEVNIDGEIYTFHFDINWNGREGEVEISEVYKENSEANVFNSMSHSVLVNLEGLIEKYGDKREWLSDKVETVDHTDCFEYMTRRM
jgi:hypothetical protein